MQDEVNQKTAALSIRATEAHRPGAGLRSTEDFRRRKKRHQKALPWAGRQSVKKLMNHYGAKNSMPLVGAPRQFDRIAKEFHVDYAFHKVSPGHYLLFFKAGQADAMTAAFQKYSDKVLNKGKDRASILDQLRNISEQIKSRPKERQKTREAVKEER